MRTTSGLAATAAIALVSLAAPAGAAPAPGVDETSLNAARDLFTAGSVQYNAVTTAWSAVGVS